MKSSIRIILSVLIAAIIGAAVGVIAMQIYVHDATPGLVTADLTAIANAKTLALATNDLDPEELEDASRQWAHAFQTLLHDVARENNIIILPRGLGIYGAEDITAQLRQFMEVEQ